MTTISSRGRLSALMALPRYTSERPFEYKFAVSKVFTPRSYLNGARETVASVRTKRMCSREFHMLDSLFFAEDPLFPTRIAVRHLILDTFNPDFPRRTVIPRVRKIHSRCFKMQCHTVGNPFCYSRGGHSCDLVRSGTRNYEATPDNYELLYIHDLVHDGSALVNDSLEKGRLNMWVTRRNNVKLGACKSTSLDPRRGPWGSCGSTISFCRAYFCFPDELSGPR